MGEEWRREQTVALGLGNETFEETCRAALKLYEFATVEAAPLLDERQSEVVGYALAISRRG
jgi:hypothetical protein